MSYKTIEEEIERLEYELKYFEDLRDKRDRQSPKDWFKDAEVCYSFSLGDLIEYKGKHYTCIVGNTGFPNDEPKSWKETYKEAWNTQLYKFKKVCKHSDKKSNEDEIKNKMEKNEK